MNTHYCPQEVGGISSFFQRSFLKQRHFRAKERNNPHAFLASDFAVAFSELTEFLSKIKSCIILLQSSCHKRTSCVKFLYHGSKKGQRQLHSGKSIRRRRS